MHRDSFRHLSRRLSAEWLREHCQRRRCKGEGGGDDTILGDVAKHVAGHDATVTTLIPAGKDPHTFEPSLRSVRDIANADVLLSNGFLLEPQNLLKSMKESSDVPVTEVADQASTRGAKLVPLVENIALDAGFHDRDI